MTQEALRPSDVVAVELNEPESELAWDKKFTVYVAD
jgi:hypothetical protein